MKRIFVITGLIIGCMLCLNACKNGTNQGSDNSVSTDIVNNPNTANGETDSTKLPVFEFNKEVHDFGKVIQGEKISYSFKFKNIGKSDLVISNATGSCGCTIADYPKTAIKPGNEGSIDVTFNTEGKKGFQSKTITLTANTQPNMKVLTIKAMVHVPEEDNN